MSGAVAAAVALGVSELAAGLLGLPSLIEGMGNWVIDVVPTPLKEWAIATFGTNDKLVLLIGIVVVTLLLGALVGVLARDRFGIATAVFIGFAAVASLAALNDPSVSLGVAVIPAGLAAITGLVTLQWLYRQGAEPAVPPAESDDPRDVSRRGFVIGLVALFGVAVLSAGIGRALVNRATRSAAGRGDVALPAAAEALPAVPEAVRAWGRGAELGDHAQ